MAWPRVRAAKAAQEDRLFRRANVVGVAVGRKTVGGLEMPEECIVVYVERKLPRDCLRPRDLVPAEVEGVPTDVVETGRFTARSMVAPEAVEHTARVRPAPGGVSVGHVRITAGTLGVLARRADGTRVILSNNHVLADSNRAAKGDLILQPGPYDGGRPADAIARLAGFVPVTFQESELGPFARIVERALVPLLARLGLDVSRRPSKASNLVDAAIAEPLRADLVSSEILEIGAVEGTAAPEIGLRVRKSGRTTGLTSGKVTAMDAVVEVDYGGRTAVFREQLVGDIPSKGGDSGSLIVDGSNRAVGLLFAGGANTTIFNPIDAVLEALGLSL